MDEGKMENLTTEILVRHSRNQNILPLEKQGMQNLKEYGSVE